MGCIATNVALPGLGTILAGKTVPGVFQIFLGTGGLAISLIYGIRLLSWMLTNWNHIYAPDADPAEVLPEIFAAILWPCVGIILFATALVWSVVSTLRIYRRARASSPRPRQAPPALQ